MGYLMGRYCGNFFFGNYLLIEGYNLWVRFVFDGLGIGMGFQVRFKNSKMVCFYKGFQNVFYKLGIMIKVLVIY